MTLEELLTGKKRPLSQREFLQWVAFFAVRAELEKQHAKNNS